MLLMPDVSEWQPSTNMAGIKKANGGAAIIRACYGTGHVDKVFNRLRADAHKAGFRALGIYHYIVPTADATLQAEFFCRLVGKLQPGEFAVLDLEEGSGNQASRAKSWLTYVDGKLGGKAWLYSGESFYNTHNLASVTKGRNVWIAAYRSSEPTVPHTLWQCTNGQVGAHITSWSGAGRCDTSVHNGTLDSFVAAVGGKEVDVPLTSDDLNKIYATVWNKDAMKVPFGTKDNPTWQPASVVTDTDAKVRTLLAGQAETQAAIAALAKKVGAPVDTNAIVTGILAGLTPAAIATAVVDALPADLAQQVVTELGHRLDAA